MGARLLLSQAEAKQVGWVVHLGHDFPKDLLMEIHSWRTNIKYVDTQERETTRARNSYSGELRGFEFLTPKIQVDHTMLDEKLLQSKAFHIIGTPERCIDIVMGISAKRQDLHLTDEDPFFAWEPMEHSCSPSNLPLFLEAMKLVNVFSPNEEEFAKLIGVDLERNQSLPDDVLRSRCDMLRLEGQLDALVVRLGARGAYVAQVSSHRHLPAYYQLDGTVNRIVDVTGGGNAFLGGYCLGMVKKILSPDLTQHESAAVFGAIAASFAIEQIGMPQLSWRGDAAELWNGVSVTARIHTYLSRISAAPPNPAFGYDIYLRDVEKIHPEI